MSLLGWYPNLQTFIPLDKSCSYCSLLWHRFCFSDIFFLYSWNACWFDILYCSDLPQLLHLHPVTTAIWLVSLGIIILCIRHRTMAYSSTIHNKETRLSLADILISSLIVSQALLISASVSEDCLSRSFFGVAVRLILSKRTKICQHWAQFKQLLLVHEYSPFWSSSRMLEDVAKEIN
jgi:hypothetical protein